MPNVYLAPHLRSRRGELEEKGYTLSGLLNDKIEEVLGIGVGQKRVRKPAKHGVA